MANRLTGQGLSDFAKSKLGTPYFYGSKLNVLTEPFMKQMHKAYPKIVTLFYMIKARLKKHVGKVNVDCSGLIAGYTKKDLGSYQLYSTAKKRMPISDINKFPIGTVLWKDGHVGIYIGKENGIPMCIEAKGINYGVIKSKVSDTKWVYGLLYDLDYDVIAKTSGTSKAQNPYHEPALSLRKGVKGQYVKWLQFELVEAGLKLAIDGDFGKKTLNALKTFQKSCKITADGICGQITRAKLKNDK